MNMQNIHWTDRSTEDYVHRLSSDFIVQLENKIESEEITAKEIAERLGVSSSAVSQVLNNPGNLELKSMVRYARALGLKLAVVAYDDNDPRNEKGPIISEIFTKCWERLGKPEDFFELQDMKQSEKCWTLYKFAQTDNQVRNNIMDVKVQRLAATGSGR